MRLLIKTDAGRKIHMVYHRDNLNPVCHCEHNFFGKKIIQSGEVEKKRLCKNCFKGMAPENQTFALDYTFI